MPRGGSRPGAGRPRKTGNEGPVDKVIKAVKAAKPLAVQPEPSAPVAPPAPPPVLPDAEPTQYGSALEFAMSMINSPVVGTGDKIKLAVALLPYQNARLEGSAPGKKETAKAAAEEASQPGSRFAPRPPPRLVASNG